MSELSFYYCRTCGASQNRLDVPTHRFCQRFRTPVTDTDFCSKHINRPYICDICGRAFIDPPILYEINGEFISMCAECDQSIGYCNTCTHSFKPCKFETDPSPLQKIVIQQIRQGNMVMQTQVRNPERINATCAQGCPCFDPHTSECLKTVEVCHQYQVRTP